MSKLSYFLKITIPLVTSLELLVIYFQYSYWDAIMENSESRLLLAAWFIFFIAYTLITNILLFLEYFDLTEKISVSKWYMAFPMVNAWLFILHASIILNNVFII